MKHSLRILLASAILACVSAGFHAETNDQWQRVYTGDDWIIELNTASLKFEAGDILRAEYRTVLTNPESTGGNSSAKYKTRLEKIDFRLTDRRYRFLEISLFDPAGKLIQTRTADASEEWRLFKPGGVTERLFNAACSLTPLGNWKVVDYRFAENGPKATRTPQLDRLIGAAVHLDLDRAQVANDVCRAPSFQDKDATRDEVLRQLGIDWKTIGVTPEDARTIDMKCEGSRGETTHSLLVKDNNKEEMLMLWEGVFLVLKRTPGGDFQSRPGSPTLKRRA